MRITSVSKHAGQAVLEGALVSLLVVGLMAGTAFAGRGGGGKGKPPPASSGSIAVVMVRDANANGTPNWNDQVTYDVSRVGVQNPFITTTCTKDGVNVLTTYAGYYQGYLWPGAQTITLSTEGWTSGAATCKAVVSNSSTTLTYAVGA